MLLPLAAYLLDLDHASSFSQTHGFNFRSEVSVQVPKFGGKRILVTVINDGQFFNNIVKKRCSMRNRTTGMLFGL
jgi:hypothetical protein